jgi:hypothetical protein
MKKNKKEKSRKEMEKECQSCDNCNSPFCKFERENGSVAFLKAAISNINNIMVARGVATEKEIMDGMLAVLNAWNEGDTSDDQTIGGLK